MFVIAQCWTNMRNDPLNADLSLQEKMGVTLKHAGVSITITTITDVLAFGIGATSVRVSTVGFSLQMKAFISENARASSILCVHSNFVRCNIPPSDHLVCCLDVS